MNKAESSPVCASSIHPNPQQNMQTRLGGDIAVDNPPLVSVAPFDIGALPYENWLCD